MAIGPSILIVKTSAIGDVIQTFPVLEYLRKKFPAARVDWAAEKGIIPLLQSHPQINRAISIDTKTWRKSPFSLSTRLAFRSFVQDLRSSPYDYVFDLQGNSKSAVVTGCSKATIKVGFDWSSVREKTNLLVTNKKMSVSSDLNIRLKYLQLVQGYFKDSSKFVPEGVRLKIDEHEERQLNHILQDEALSRRPRLMVCFGSKWINKQLELSTLTALLHKIAVESDPSFVFIFGDDQEKRIADELALLFKDRALALGRLSLPLWQRFMWEMDGVIAVDSAALHLCGTTFTPSLSVFGPSASSCYKPIGEQHFSVQGSCPYNRTFTSRCPILRSCTTGACIRLLEVQTLFESYKRWSGTFLQQSV